MLSNVPPHTSVIAGLRGPSDGGHRSPIHQHESVVSPEPPVDCSSSEPMTCSRELSRGERGADFAHEIYALELVVMAMK